MTPRLRCLVLMPVGPRSDPAFVRDTVESFLFYMPAEDAGMLLLDDSGSDRLDAALPTSDRVRRVTTGRRAEPGPERIDTFGSLFVAQVRALRDVEADGSWECLLRLDDDALLIGPSPHLDALDVFRRSPDVGMLGAYQRRGDGTVKVAAMRAKGRVLLRQLHPARAVRAPRRTWLLARALALAVTKGYRPGDMCTGGSFFLSRAAWDALLARWDGQLEALADSRLDDDLLFALFVSSVGFRLEDFSDPEHPLAVNWRGLPMPLSELVRRGKKVVHPVKDPADPRHEAEVRRFFRARRGAAEPT